MDLSAPRWELEVSPGVFLSADLKRLVRSVTCDATLDGADELVVQADGWDSIDRRWRLIGETILGPGSQVVLWAGDGRSLSPMQRFRMAREEVNYGPGGAKVTLRGYSAEARFAEATEPRVWSGPSVDSEIARELAGIHDCAVTATSLDPTGEVQGGRLKKAGDTDWSFLQQIAEANGYGAPWVRYDADTGRDVLHFRAQRLDQQPHVATFRRAVPVPTLLQFSPSLSLQGIPTAVEVVGWDAGAGQPFRVVARVNGAAGETTVQIGPDVGRLDEPITSGGKARARALRDGGADPDRPEVRYVPSASTPEAAEAWARRWLRTQSTAAQTARATTVGHVDAWVGQAHRFAGLAPHHEGLWFAVGCRHSWSSAGYRCDWDLERIVEEQP
jgi:phage protein D